MKTLAFATLCVLTLALSSCYRDGDGLICKRASGKMETETRTLDAFTSIDLLMAADVIIEQGEEYSVEIEASDNILDLIKTSVSGGELNIRVKTRECIRGNADITITVTAPYIKEIKVAGSGKITNRDGWKTDELKIDISGSGDIQLSDLEINAYDVNITGSGTIELSGEPALEGIVDISGSGEFDAFDLEVDDCEIDITGSGTAKVTVNENLNVRISGSGDVYYKGRPQIDQRITGSGDIKNSN